MIYRLLGVPGTGSAIVEAALTLTGAAFEFHHASPWEEGPGRQELAALNPLVEIPTLVLPDGQVTSESASICLLLAERYPASGLAPAAGTPERADFLRWLIFLVANIYPTFTYGDDPSRWLPEKAAQDALRASTDARRLALWQLVEDAARPGGPWFLGPVFCAVDLFVGVMAHWRPGRAAFRRDFPRLEAIAAQLPAHAGLQAVWQRNFPQP